MTRTIQNPILIKISNNVSDLHQEWDEKMWIGVGSDSTNIGAISYLVVQTYEYGCHWG